jgi:hypothetical protein
MKTYNLTYATKGSIQEFGERVLVDTDQKAAKKRFQEMYQPEIEKTLNVKIRVVGLQKA